MPGMVGIISKNSEEENRSNLQVLINAMTHEGTYECGRYINESLGLYAGWVCHRGSFVDCMPVWNESRDKCLLFYGENFIDTTVISSLKKRDHLFNAHNASYLIHLYEERGDEFFSLLNGFFHGVLIDGLRNEVMVFNDRYGMQRLYYYEKKGSFLFSSEAKCLLKLCPELREINPASLAQLFCMECVLENETLFKNIQTLPGGSLWKFKHGSRQKKRFYFSRKDWESQAPLAKEAFYSEFKRTFVSILPRYMNDTMPLGMSLTGGLDTRMIMAHARRPSGTLPCYTFGSRYRDGFDVRVARRVAAACKQKHYKITVDGNFSHYFSELSEKAVFISDGYLDAASGATELYLNRKAREIAPVRITGNYGSEVLRSIRAFRYKPPRRNLFDGGFVRHMDDAAELFESSVKGRELSFTVFKQAPWYNFNRLSLEQSQLTQRTPFMDNELVKLVYKAPREVVTNDDLSLQLIGDGDIELRKIITNRGVKGHSSNFVTKFMQRCYEILHFGEIGYDYGMPQWAARIDYYLRPFHLEKVFLGWNNVYHFRTAYRNELSGYVREVLLDRRTANRPYWKKQGLEEIVNGHLRGDRNFVIEITKILTAELIHRLLIENY